MAKSGISTTVNLTELPESGLEFSFDEKTGELNQVLEDLIHKRPHFVRIFIRPIGDIYEISGEVKATLPLLCSRCGRDVEHEINDHFQELIMIEKPRPRKGTPSSHEGHSTGPFCNYVTSPIFNLAEFSHEHIAAAEPYIIECKRPDCGEYLQKIHGEPPDLAENRSNPFEILKKIIKN